MNRLFAVLYLMLAYCLLILGFALFPSLVAAQTTTETSAPVVVGDPSPNDVREFKRLLADPTIQKWLVTEAAETNEDDDEATGQTFRKIIAVIASRVRDRMSDLGQAMGNLREAPQIIMNSWQSTVSGTDTLRIVTYVLIFLFVGAGLEWLYAQYTHSQLLALELTKPDGLGERMRTSFFRALITFGGLAVFSVGSIGAYLSFDWPEVVAEIVLNVLIVVLILRIATTVARFFLAPKFKELRLVPFNSQQAKSVYNWIALLVFAGSLNFAISDVFEHITELSVSDVPKYAALSVDVGANLLWLAIALLAIWQIRKLFQAESQSASGPSRFWVMYLTVLTVVVFVLWLIGVPALMWTALILGLLFPVLSATREWVNNLFDQAEKVDTLHGAASLQEDVDPTTGEEIPATAEEGGDGSEEALSDAEPGRYDTYRPLTNRIVRFVIVIAAVIGLMAAWGTNPFSLSTSPTLSGRLFEIAVDIVVALLIADLIWVWAKSAIDRRMGDYKSPPPGAAPGPEARMATLLPLLRSMLMFTLLAMVALSILSSFGVNIGPLLAGAGVLGVAIGFGAQALVRDVVSGIFFLIDDAFRIGEYIEVDGLVGTVEAMSIRSLRVRHHRGIVHTIPFGELKSLSNHSRDWVIMKLEFRVPFETDLKLAKKLVKKIGAEMKANEDWGHSIIETLKFQGVRRMEEFNMVVGVKFMTKPGEQWIIRREAYQRVRDAFEANGIVFAERQVKVEVVTDRPLTEAEEKAVMGAAQNAAEPPPGPPVPIPDEP